MSDSTTFDWGEGKPPMVAVDLDGTLARSSGGPHKPDEIGEPILEMVMTVFNHLHAGHRITIFTARANPTRPGWEDNVRAIQAWCYKHFSQVFPVTAIKSHEMVVFYDDRAIQIIRNTGKRIDGQDGSIDLEVNRL